jgi:hypothetical protein
MMNTCSEAMMVSVLRSSVMIEWLDDNRPRGSDAQGYIHKISSLGIGMSIER